MSPAPRRTVGAGCGAPRVTALSPLVNGRLEAPRDGVMSAWSHGREAVDPLRRLVARLDALDVPGRPRPPQRGEHAAGGVRRSFEYGLDAAVGQVRRRAGETGGLSLDADEPA